MPDLQGELREFFPSYYHIHVGDIWILLQDREDMDDQVDGATSDQTALDMEHRSIPSQEIYKRTKEAEEIVDAPISEMLSDGVRSGSHHCNTSTRFFSDTRKGILQKPRPHFQNKNPRP